MAFMTRAVERLVPRLRGRAAQLQGFRRPPATPGTTWSRCRRCSWWPTTSTGRSAPGQPAPSESRITSTSVVAQWLVYDPATLAYAATQMHEIRLL